MPILAWEIPTKRLFYGIKRGYGLHIPYYIYMNQ